MKVKVIEQILYHSKKHWFELEHLWNCILLYFVEHLRREAVVASSRLTYKLMDTLNNG